MVNRNVFIIPYTPKKKAKDVNSLETRLDTLKGIGPLFATRLADQGFNTLGDISQYLQRPTTTRKKATLLFRRIFQNPRGGECLGEDSRLKSNSGRKYGNRYQVRKINAPAYLAIQETLKNYYSKRRNKHSRSMKKKVPPQLQPRKRKTIEAFPRSCPPDAEGRLPDQGQNQVGGKENSSGRNNSQKQLQPRVRL
mgnify:CR=1 FL=1